MEHAAETAQTAPPRAREQPPAAAPPRKRARPCYNSDEERIEAKLRGLPSYVHSVSALDGFCPGASAGTLRAACAHLGVDVRAFVERHEYERALEALPVRTLKDLCARHNLLAASEALERADLLAAVRQAAADKGAETCAICCEPFRHGQRVILLLCQHEFHPGCARKAALSDFAQTREFPRCALCREPMRQHV